MARIIIKGKKEYIKRLSTHLKKEHPSTKKRMKTCLKQRRRRG